MLSGNSSGCHQSGGHNSGLHTIDPGVAISNRHGPEISVMESKILAAILDDETVLYSERIPAVYVGYRAPPLWPGFAGHPVLAALREGEIACGGISCTEL